MKETELAKKVIEYLQDMKWDVYQEVQPSCLGKIADIVAIQNNLVWVIECKTTLSLSVIEQAYEWRGFANFISVATPTTTKRRSRNFVYKILKDYGIGCLEVEKFDEVGWRPSGIQIKVNSKFHRKTLKHYILNSLTNKHKTWAEAGNSDGKRYTPFQNTVDQLYKIVKNNPGITFKEVMNKISHHYSSDKCAKTSLSAWIRQGVIKNIRTELKGKSYTLYYEK